MPSNPCYPDLVRTLQMIAEETANNAIEIQNLESRVDGLQSLLNDLTRDFSALKAASKSGSSPIHFSSKEEKINIAPQEQVSLSNAHMPSK